MATKQETINEAIEGRGCLGKAASDEPVFVLRAQDAHAPDLVRKWAAFARTSGAGLDKVRGAEQIADDMEAWQEINGRKFPD